MIRRGFWFCLLCGLLLAGAAQAAVVELTHGTGLVTVGGGTTHHEVTLPYHWDRQHKGQAGEMMVELPFALPSLTEEPHGLYFQRIGNTAEIWLNDTLLARFGDPSRPNSADYAKGPQYVAIPSRLLDKDNVLRIRVGADGGRRGGLATVLVGPENEVRARYSNAFRWRVSASMGVTIFSLLVGVVALMLWVTQTDPAHLLANRRDPIYLMAGLAEICWALRVGDVAIEHPPLPWPLWGVLMTAAFAGWFCCIALFCHHVAGWHRHRSMPWMKAGLTALFASAIVASTLSFRLQQPLYLTVWLGSANVFFVVYASVYLWGAIRKPDIAWLLVALAGALNVLMGVRDWVAIRISGGYADNTWIRYSSLLFGLALAYIVITRFREVSAQARDLMANLSARIAQKEQELGESYLKVEQLAREQERVGERTRILRDMHDGVGAHLSAAIRQLQSGKASTDDVPATRRRRLAAGEPALPAGAAFCRLGHRAAVGGRRAGAGGAGGCQRHAPAAVHGVRGAVQCAAAFAGHRTGHRGGDGRQRRLPAHHRQRPRLRCRRSAAQGPAGHAGARRSNWRAAAHQQRAGPHRGGNPDQMRAGFAMQLIADFPCPAGAGARFS
jgi:hypothetical protein